MSSNPSPSSSPGSTPSSLSISTISSSCPELSASLEEAIRTNPPPLFSSPGFAGSSSSSGGRRHPRQQCIPDYTHLGAAPPRYALDETAPRVLLGDSDGDDGRVVRRGWREAVRPWCQAVLLLVMGLVAAAVVVLVVVFLVYCFKAWVE